VYVGDKKAYRNLDRVQPVARYYGFPEVDVRTHLQKKIDTGEVKWEDVARDGIHPNERGHQIYAEAMTGFLKQESERKEVTNTPAIPQPFKGDDLTTATLLPISSIKVSQEWKATPPPEWTGKFFDEMYATDQTGATMTVTANTTVMGLYLLQSTDSGQIEWSVDGGEPKTLNLWASWLVKDKWYARSFILAEGLPRGEHILTVKVLTKSDKSDGNWIRVGGICVTNPKP